MKNNSFNLDDYVLKELRSHDDSMNDDYSDYLTKILLNREISEINKQDVRQQYMQYIAWKQMTLTPPTAILMRKHP